MRVFGAKFSDREGQLVDEWLAQHGRTQTELVRRAVLDLIGAPELGEHGGRESGEPARAVEAAAASPAVQSPSPPSGKVQSQEAQKAAKLALQRFDRLVKLDLNDMALRVWNFSRSAERSQDPLAYIREVIRHAAADQKIPDLTDQELAQILGQLKERSTTVKKLLAGEIP